MVESLVTTLPCCDQWIEPSAGDGAFLGYLPENTIALDIYPEHPKIIKKDWFDFKDDLTDKGVVGNPPFGFASSLAVRFFNHAGKLNSKYICFVIPKTFRKESVVKKLDKYYHLLYDVDVPKNSFVLNNKEYNVPCCWQIWERKEIQRETNISIDLKLFDVVEHDYDFLVRRVGGKAGEIVLHGSKSSTYKIRSNINKDSLLCLWEQAVPVFKTIRENTAGVRSVSLKEMKHVLSELYINKRY